MTDRELLELAAKAAGYKKYYSHYLGRDSFVTYEEAYYSDVKKCQVVGEKTMNWNPLTDDGDSRRLQVALSIDLRFGVSDNFGPYVHASTEVRRGDFIDFYECYQWVSLHPGGDAAARSAVLEVAASIGQSMS